MGAPETNPSAATKARLRKESESMMNQTVVFFFGCGMGLLAAVFAWLTARLLTGPRQSRREYAMGFGTTSVPGESSCKVSVRAGVRFLPERLLVSPRGGDFLIREVSVDGVPVFRPVGTAPVDVLGPGDSFPLGGRVAEAGSLVSIDVSNQAANPRDFQAVVVGSCGRL